MNGLSRARKLALVGLLCLCAAGCATPPQSASLLRQAPEQLGEAVTIAEVPFFPQDQYQCGPAALATVLVASGVDVTPEALVPLVYVPERKGSFQVELVAAARSHGRVAYTLPPTLDALLAEVRNGTPVLVLQNLGLASMPKWHYAVVKGYDLERRKLLLNSGVHEDYEVSLGTFERTWARAEHWGLAVVAPGEVPVSAEALPYFNAVVALELGGHTELARSAYKAGLARWPDDRNLLMAYGNLLYGAGELNAAAASFRAVTKYHPAYAPAHNNLAQLLFELGQLDHALAAAKTAVALGGDYSATYQETIQLIAAAASSTVLETDSPLPSSD
ncbi:MAG TPA: PA2778 family cysteine peptidase [Pseudomonadales bacterium]